jgi:hypothetical protein
MCGLIGFSGTKPCDINKIRVLMYVNSQERGEDATGLYSPLNGLEKSLSKGWEVAKSNKTVLQPDTTLIAHVRAKTIGVNSIQNTHPFERGNYILAHNGTLKNYNALLRKYDLNATDYNVDSDIIAGCIAKDDGFDVLPLLEGAAALLIHDKTKPNRLYVFKKGSNIATEQRTLFKGSLDGGMYISSLEEPLMMIGCKNIKPFKDDVLYTIENGAIKKEVTVKNVGFVEPYSISRMPAMGTSDTHYKIIGTWMRSKHTFTYRPNGYKGKEYQFVKGTYYWVTSVISSTLVTVVADGKPNSEWIKMPLANLEYDDILWGKDVDYVMALEDISTTYQFAANTVKYPKGSILKCTNSYVDGDVSVSSPTDSTTSIMTKRWLVRKLTAEERKEFLVTCPVTPTPKTVSNSRHMTMDEILAEADDEEAAYLRDYYNYGHYNTPVVPATNADIVTENDDSPFENDDESPEDKDFDDDGLEADYDPIEVDYPTLHVMFDELDEFAEQINELYAKDPKSEALGNKIIDLMKYVYECKEYYTVNSEEEESCQ